MKRIILFSLLFLSINLFAQEEYDEDYLVKDPGNIVSTDAELSQTLSDFNFTDKSIGIGGETMISGNMKYFNIPFHYKPSSESVWMFNAYLPIIYQKKWITETARGLGDLVVGASYFQNKTLEEGLVMNGSFDITLPTGNDEKEVNNVIIPLGGGSFGFIGSFATHVILGGGVLHSTLNYKYNTYNKTVTSVASVSETTTKRRSPGILSISSSYVYNIFDDLYLSGAFIYNYLGEGYFTTTTTFEAPNIPDVEADGTGQTNYYLDLSFEAEYKFEAEKYSSIALLLNSAYMKFKLPIAHGDLITSRNPVFTVGIRRNF